MTSCQHPNDSRADIRYNRRLVHVMRCKYGAVSRIWGLVVAQRLKFCANAGKIHDFKSQTCHRLKVWALSMALKPHLLSSNVWTVFCFMRASLDKHVCQMREKNKKQAQRNTEEKPGNVNKP